jgi:hypothetical protein
MMDSSLHLRVPYRKISKQEDKYWDTVYLIASLWANEKHIDVAFDDVKSILKTRNGKNIK